MFKQFLLLSVLILAPFVSSADNNATFIGISDIHFNPYFGCPPTHCALLKKLEASPVEKWSAIFLHQTKKTYSPYGTDTNYYLLEMALQKAQRVLNATTPKPKFILLNGDFLAHYFKKSYFNYNPHKTQRDYQRFVSKVFSFLTQRLVATFPHTPMYPSIGNNDSFHDDYYVEPDGQFYKTLTNQQYWGKLFLNKNNRKQFKETFPIGGYYQITPPGEPNHRIIVLNSLLFSPHVSGNQQKIQPAAFKELHWLAKQLANAKTEHHKVWLMYHISTGMDTYNSIHSKNLVSFLSTNTKRNYNQALLKIIQQYAANITLLVTSHDHKDIFHLINNTINTFIPSISPQLHNNPGFRLYSYQVSNGAYDFWLQNYDTYYLPLNNKTPIWQFEYNFKQAYKNVPGNKNSPSRLLTIMQAVAADKSFSQFARLYQRYYTLQGQPNITAKNWKYYRCAIVTSELDRYRSCINQH